MLMKRNTLAGQLFRASLVYVREMLLESVWRKTKKILRPGIEPGSPAPWEVEFLKSGYTNPCTIEELLCLE